MRLSDWFLNAGVYEAIWLVVERSDIFSHIKRTLKPNVEFVRIVNSENLFVC